MNVSISIMAHPARRAWVTELRDQLGPVPVAWDQRNNEWDTGARAWRLHDPDADWHLVLQDDAILCPNFADRLHTTLEQAPTGPVSLYIGTGRPRQTQVQRALRDADGSITLPWLLWGVAIALPVAHIPAMLHACRTGHHEYDRRISRWYEQQRTPTWYPCPSLVDHRDEGSLLGHDHGTPRRAHALAQ